jgi:hypothetical protein
MAVIDRKFDRKILIMRSRSRSRFFQFIAIAVAISENWPRSWSRDQTIAIVTKLTVRRKHRFKSEWKIFQHSRLAAVVLQGCWWITYILLSGPGFNVPCVLSSVSTSRSNPFKIFNCDVFCLLSIFQQMNLTRCMIFLPE